MTSDQKKSAQPLKHYGPTNQLINVVGHAIILITHKVIIKEVGHGAIVVMVDTNGVIG